MPLVLLDRRYTKYNAQDTLDNIKSTSAEPIQLNLKALPLKSAKSVLQDRAIQLRQDKLPVDSVLQLILLLDPEKSFKPAAAEIISLAPNPIGQVAQSNFTYGPGPDYITFKTDHMFIEKDGVLYSPTVHKSMSPADYMDNVEDAIQESFAFPLPQLLVKITGDLTVDGQTKPETFTLEGWRQPSSDAYEIYDTIMTTTIKFAIDAGIENLSKEDGFTQRFPIRQVLSSVKKSPCGLKLDDIFPPKDSLSTPEATSYKEKQQNIYNLVDCFSMGYKLLKYTSEKSKRKYSINQSTLQLLQGQFEHEVGSFLRSIEEHEG